MLCYLRLFYTNVQVSCMQSKAIAHIYCLFSAQCTLQQHICLTLQCTTELALAFIEKQQVHSLCLIFQLHNDRFYFISSFHTNQFSMHYNAKSSYVTNYIFHITTEEVNCSLQRICNKTECLLYHSSMQKPIQVRLCRHCNAKTYMIALKCTTTLVLCIQ